MGAEAIIEQPGAMSPKCDALCSQIDYPANIVDKNQIYFLIARCETAWTTCKCGSDQYIEQLFAADIFSIRVAFELDPNSQPTQRIKVK